MLRPRLLPLLAVIVAALGCGGKPGSPPESCPQLECKIACAPGGTRKDDRTGCPTCLCAAGALPDAGAACPPLSCSGSCGLGAAVDPGTGCPTCTCCNPADCVSGCHGFGADGCPTCGPC